MAVVVTDRRTVVNEADNSTGWNTGSVITSFFAEATACIALALNDATGQLYFTGTARNLSNTLIYVYSFNNALQESWDAANPPNALHLGDGTNRVTVRQAGANRRVFNHLDGPTDWQCLLVDGALISTLAGQGLTVNRAGTVGALNLASITQLGADHTTLSKALGGGQNVAVDIIRVGNDGLRVTGGTTGDRGNFLEIAIEDRSTANLKAHGLIRELTTEVYSAQGPLTFGGPTETSWFEEDGIVLAYENRYVADDKYYLQVEGGSGATHFILRGSTIKSAGPGVRCDFQVGGAANIDTLIVANTVFGSLLNPVIFGNNSNHEVTGCTFDGCGQVRPSGVQFRNNAVLGSTDPDGAMLVGPEGTGGMSSLSFSGGAGHAVRFTSPGTYSLIGWSFSGYGADGTATAAVVNASGGLVTLNLSGGSDAPTVLNVGGATTAVQNVVTFQLTGLVDNTEVRIYRASDDVELFGVENSSGGEVVYEYNAVGDVPVYIHIHHINYVFIRLELTLGGQSVSIPVQQRFDRNYSNPD